MVAKHLLTHVLLLLAGTWGASALHASPAARENGATAAATCAAASAPVAPTVLELYTSEGCSSCPPADRWLSRLKGRSDVLALAFHVSYWDRLGWPDRFALAEGTARQHHLAQHAGSTQVYTPQVVANGRDWPQWHKAALPTRPAAAPQPAVKVRLQRQGAQVTATVEALPGTAQQGPLSGYWAVLEDQHSSKVRAGENAGEYLQHDHVVRQYKPVAAWPAAAGHQSSLVAGPTNPANPQRVVFVVTDAATLRPVQAVALGC